MLSYTLAFFVLFKLDMYICINPMDSKCCDEWLESEPMQELPSEFAWHNKFSQGSAHNA